MVQQCASFKFGKFVSNEPRIMIYAVYIKFASHFLNSSPSFREGANGQIRESVGDISRNSGPGGLKKIG